MTELTFEALPLAAPIKRALSEKGYSTPSPIQARAIPVLLEGRDLLACAQTGTGKTAAFSLPILQRIFADRAKTKQYKVRVLVLTPTRELAVQIADSFRTYGKYMRFSLGLVHGGVSQRPQERALQGGLDVLVATPGRLLDLYEQNCFDFDEVDTFILDEADRMLDMGFIHDIRRIAKELPKERQTLLFSATMAKEVEQLAIGLLNEPEDIRIAPAATTAEKVEQRIFFVQHDDKRELLTRLLETRVEENPDELTLVFSKTKHGANRLATQLCKDGIPSEAIHGNKTQAARQKALDRFRQGKTNVLVATDVAARGIDVKDITLVVNYDLPMEADSYVHRIGRTARAGASGLAISFCSAEELKLLTAIEKLIRQQVPVDEEHDFHAESVAIRYRNHGAARGARGQSGPRSGGFARKGGSAGGRGKRVFERSRPQADAAASGGESRVRESGHRDSGAQEFRNSESRGGEPRSHEPRAQEFRSSERSAGDFQPRPSHGRGAPAAKGGSSRRGAGRAGAVAAAGEGSRGGKKRFGGNAKGGSWSRSRG